MADLPVGVIGQPVHRPVEPGINRGQGHVLIRRLATVVLIVKVTCLKPQLALTRFVQVGMFFRSTRHNKLHHVFIHFIQKLKLTVHSFILFCTFYHLHDV